MIRKASDYIIAAIIAVVFLMFISTLHGCASEQKPKVTIVVIAPDLPERYDSQKSLMLPPRNVLFPQ